MELLCTKKYWSFPTNPLAQDKRIYFYVDGKLVYDLVVPLDYNNPDCEFYLNVERFIGKNVRLECSEEMDLSVKESNEDDGIYDGRYRPLSHFTAKRGWINDPNGLVFYKGVYHMFFQYNPVDCKWGNMHWGHAVSTDLIHWQEKDIVFYPDENGTIFSGSAIVDWKNVTGLKQNENDVILIFYTCAGNTSETSKGKTFTQNLAYSVDGGLTFKKYPANPLINQVAWENRDPKVIYFEKDDSYIMAFFLKDHQYVIYKSQDLIHWHKIQDVFMEEDAECPDFFPLHLDGNKDNTKWIFIGASDRYYVGEFDGEKYVIQSDLQRLNYGNSSYAAQTWSDMMDGRRVRTAFSKIIVPGEPFACCMDLPQELSLRTIDNKIKLCVQPVDEIKKLYSSQKKFVDCEITKDKNFIHELSSKCCDITIKGKSKQSFAVKIFGLKIEYDGEKSELMCLDKKCKVTGIDGELEIRFLIDTLSAEIFADGGSVFMGMSYVQDFNLNKFQLGTKNSSALFTIDISEMKSFWT